RPPYRVLFAQSLNHIIDLLVGHGSLLAHDREAAHALQLDFRTHFQLDVERQIGARLVAHVLYGTLRDRLETFALERLPIRIADDLLDGFLLDRRPELALHHRGRYATLPEPRQLHALRQPLDGVLLLLRNPLRRYRDRQPSRPSARLLNTDPQLGCFRGHAFSNGE